MIIHSKPNSSLAPNITEQKRVYVSWIVALLAISVLTALHWCYPHGTNEVPRNTEGPAARRAEHPSPSISHLSSVLVPPDAEVPEPQKFALSPLVADRSSVFSRFEGIDDSRSDSTFQAEAQSAMHFQLVSDLETRVGICEQSTELLRSAVSQCQSALIDAAQQKVQQCSCGLVDNVVRSGEGNATPELPSSETELQPDCTAVRGGSGDGSSWLKLVASIVVLVSGRWLLAVTPQAAAPPTQHSTTSASQTEDGMSLCAAEASSPRQRNPSPQPGRSPSQNDDGEAMSPAFEDFVAVGAVSSSNRRDAPWTGGPTGTAAFAQRHQLAPAAPMAELQQCWALLEAAVCASHDAALLSFTRQAELHLHRETMIRRAAAHHQSTLKAALHEASVRYSAERQRMQLQAETAANHATELKALRSEAAQWRQIASDVAAEKDSLQAGQQALHGELTAHIHALEGDLLRSAAERETLESRAERAEGDAQRLFEDIAAANAALQLKASLAAEAERRLLETQLKLSLMEDEAELLRRASRSRADTMERGCSPAAHSAAGMTFSSSPRRRLYVDQAPHSPPRGAADVGVETEVAFGTESVATQTACAPQEEEIDNARLEEGCSAPRESLSATGSSDDSRGGEARPTDDVERFLEELLARENKEKNALRMELAQLRTGRPPTLTDGYSSLGLGMRSPSHSSFSSPPPCAGSLKRTDDGAAKSEASTGGQCSPPGVSPPSPRCRSTTFTEFDRPAEHHVPRSFSSSDSEDASTVPREELHFTLPSSAVNKEDSQQVKAEETADASLPPPPRLQGTPGLPMKQQRPPIVHVYNPSASSNQRHQVSLHPLSTTNPRSDVTRSRSTTLEPLLPPKTVGILKHHPIQRPPSPSTKTSPRVHVYAPGSPRPAQSKTEVAGVASPRDGGAGHSAHREAAVGAAHRGQRLTLTFTHLGRI
jgi:hypothetical protein